MNLASDSLPHRISLSLFSRPSLVAHLRMHSQKECSRAVRLRLCVHTLHLGPPMQRGLMERLDRVLRRNLSDHRFLIPLDSNEARLALAPASFTLPPPLPLPLKVKKSDEERSKLRDRPLKSCSMKRGRASVSLCCSCNWCTCRSADIKWTALWISVSISAYETAPSSDSMERFVFDALFSPFSMCSLSGTDCALLCGCCLEHCLDDDDACPLQPPLLDLSDGGAGCCLPPIGLSLSYMSEFERRMVETSGVREALRCAMLRQLVVLIASKSELPVPPPPPPPGHVELFTCWYEL